MHCVDSQSDEMDEQRNASRQLLRKQKVHYKQRICDLTECGWFMYKRNLVL